MEDWDQTALSIGTAVIGLADYDCPFLFKFESFYTYLDSVLD